MQGPGTMEHPSSGFGATEDIPGLPAMPLATFNLLSTLPFAESGQIPADLGAWAT